MPGEGACDLGPECLAQPAIEELERAGREGSLAKQCLLSPSVWLQISSPQDKGQGPTEGFCFLCHRLISGAGDPWRRGSHARMWGMYTHIQACAHIRPLPSPKRSSLGPSLATQPCLFPEATSRGAILWLIFLSLAVDVGKSWGPALQPRGIFHERQGRGWQPGPSPPFSPLTVASGPSPSPLLGSTLLELLRVIRLQKKWIYCGWGRKGSRGE